MSQSPHTTITEGLTREQLKAIRNADIAVLRWNQTAAEPADVLELVKEIKEPNGFGRYDLRVQLPCRARVANYGQSEYGEDKRRYLLKRAISGDWVLLSVRYHAEWSTFANFLKPGDVLEQHWVVDNRNDLLREAGLTHHELKLCVLRPVKGKDGAENTKVHTFMLDASVHNPHNLADNVRRES